MMLHALINAAVFCTCAAASGGLAIMIRHALTYFAVCCACATASGWLAIMMRHELIYYGTLQCAVPALLHLTALLGKGGGSPQLYYHTVPRSHHKGATGRTGDRPSPTVRTVSSFMPLPTWTRQSILLCYTLLCAHCAGPALLSLTRLLRTTHK